MKQAYIQKNLRSDTLAFIDTLNGIVYEYQELGFVLTVRQLYYQLVARDVIPNTLQEYKRVASIINDAKLAGLLDWDAIEDRTRDFVRRTRWESGPSILNACIHNYHQDMWVNQSHRVFVIVEKEALVGVLTDVCHRYDIPLLAARGYPSGTVLREFSETDLITSHIDGQTAVVLHLGDHDPSGIDMTRDLRERLSLFSDMDVELERIALNMQQIEELRPPENPAKATDSRFSAYRKRYGSKSWELDALKPTYLAELVEQHVTPYIDQDAWSEIEAEVTSVKAKIRSVADQWGVE